MATFSLNAEVTIGNYRTTFVHEVKIVSTWQSLSDTCTITLPNLQGQLERTFAAGDAVSVRLGYNGALVSEFSGYVARLRPRVPFQIECEDAMWLLRRSTLKGKSWTRTTLAEVLAYALKGQKVAVSPSTPQVRLEPFFIAEGATVAQVLQKLKEEYLLAVYFRGDTIYIGLPYNEQLTGTGARATYELFGDRCNVISDSSLEFATIDDLKLKGEVVNILPDNRRQKITVGDPNGEVRTILLRTGAPLSDAALRSLGEEELSKFRFDGYRGGITTFGVPFVLHSGTAIIKDPRYTERAGSYVIDEVATTYGMSGFRRVLKLGKKISL
jgi:hypothetical protein